MCGLGNGVDLVVFDMDGVLIDARSSWVLVHRHFGTDNEDSLQAFLRGEIDDQEFIRRDVERWASVAGGVHISEVEAVLDEAPLYPGAVETLLELHGRGVRTAIVSGGLSYLADRIGRMGLVDHVHANDVVVDANGHLTGGGLVHVPLLKKGLVVEAIQEEAGIGPGRTGAIGDSLVDATMFERAAVSIAFNPRDTEIEGAAVHVVRSRDLRSVLPLLIGDGT
jgi:phosphoserine phosphatase